MSEQLSSVADATPFNPSDIPEAKADQSIASTSSPTPAPSPTSSPAQPSPINRTAMDDQSMQQFQDLPDTRRTIENAKAMLYDRQGFNGKAPQALQASKTKDDPQQFRDGTAAVAGMSAILGIPAETIAENFSQYQNKIEGAMGWDHSPNVGGFANNLASHFQTQDAQQKAVKDLQTKAVQDYATFAEKRMSSNPLAAFADWNKATGDAFKGVSEDQKVKIFDSVYSPIQKQMATPEGQKALQLFQALQQNKEAPGIPEQGADQASADVSQGKEAPDQPEKIDPVQFLKGLPENQQNKVISLASQLMQANQPDTPNGIKVAGGLGQAFAQGFISWGAIGNLDDLVEAEKRLKAAQTPEDAQKAQDDIENIKLSQKIKQADQQANSVNPELYGLPKIAYKVGQGVAGMPGSLAPALVPVLGEFAFYKQAQAEDALKLMEQNPSMSAEEAKSRSTIASAAYGITMGRLAPLIGEASPGLTGFLVHTAQSTAIMQGAEGERILGRQLQSLIDPSFNPKEQYGQEWLDLLKATPYTFATLAAFGGAIKLMNRGQAPDPNSFGELEKQAGNARTLQYLGIDAETAQKIAAMPEGQRVKALGSEWDKRTDEQKQAGVELARQDAADVEKKVSAPDAPKVEQTPDGKYVVTTKQGEETHSVPFETEEGAKAGLQMSLEDHLNKIQDENLSWEEQMHRAEAVAKLHLMEGTDGENQGNAGAESGGSPEMGSGQVASSVKQSIPKYLADAGVSGDIASKAENEISSKLQEISQTGEGQGGYNYLPVQSEEGTTREVRNPLEIHPLQRAGVDSSNPFEQNGNVVSSLVHSLVTREIPSFNIDGAVLKSPKDFAALLMPLRSPYFESVKVAFLDKEDRVIHSQILHVGTLDESVAHPRDFLLALSDAKKKSPDVVSAIFAHNHPSGNPEPSAADRKLTTRIEEAFQNAGIKLKDHIITNGKKGYSFTQGGTFDIGAGIAPWEAVDRDSLKIIRSPSELGEYIANLRQGADPEAAHIIYTNTQGAISAVERVPNGSVDSSTIKNAIIEGISREGAKGVFLDFSGKNWIATRSALDAAKKAAENLMVSVFDVSNKDIPSHKNNGLLEEPLNKYGESSLKEETVKDQPSRDRIQAELEKRMASGPDVKTRIFENAAKRFEAITKRQNTVMEAFAKGDASSSDVIKKDMERNLVEVNAILSALPPDIRASLTRNWRNPKTGEGGNIYTKYASLGSEKAKADFLIKQIDKASDLIDHALSSEYLERGYKLLEAAQPFNERGKGLQGKIGPEGHETINKITDLWHMDEGQVADYIQSRQKQLADPEISDEKRDELEQEIHLANIHGNFSPVDAKGTYKHLGDEMPADARAQAIESLKQIIETGRLDWKAEKDANKAKWEANRSEVKEAILGEDREATSAEIAKSREGASMMLSGVSNFFDSHLSHLARFTQILGDAAKPWVRRILDATNQKADLDQKLDHESHSAMIKALFGDKAKDNLANRTRFKMVLSDLSIPKDTGAISIENRQYKKTKFSKTIAESFIKDPTSWMGTDTELNYLSRALSDLTPKSRVKGFDIYYPKKGTGEEVNLHLSEMEAIQRLLSWRQPDARLKMERNGMSQETADKLEEFVNKTKEGAAFYNYLKGAYDHYEKINAVYRKMFGVDMPRVKNYAPTAYDTAKGTEDPVSLDEYGGGASSMAGFTKTRQSHIAKVKDSNAWVTYQAHSDAVNYWLSHAELVRDFRATFGNTDVLRAAEVKSVADRKYLTDFIKYLSRDNSTTQALTGWNSKFARAASNILSNSALAFNIPVTLKHIIPAVSSAMKMDAGQFVVSALRVAIGQAERPAIFGENNLYSSTEVMRFSNAAHSGSDSDAVQAAKESKGLGRKTKLGLEAAGKWGHSWITSLVHASNAVSSAIAYDGAYREAIKAGLKPEDAHAMASQRVDEVLHETSQPVFGVDRPIGEEGNPLQATIARFAGPVRQRFGIAVDSVKGAPAKIAAADTPLQKFGAIGDVSWKLAAAWVIPGLMEHAVKQAYLAILGTNQQQEDANKLNEYIGAALAGPVYGMYYAGPVAAAAIKAAITGEKAHLSTGNPLFDEANSLVGAVKRKMGNKSDKTPISDYITLAKVSMDMAAMLMGLVGLNHAATATASVSGALNPARVISKKLEDDGKVKGKK